MPPIPDLTGAKISDAAGQLAWDAGPEQSAAGTCERILYLAVADERLDRDLARLLKQAGGFMCQTED